ncbi:FAD-dependent oxidoreductase [candidate division KSB1 bacterium]|nr:FAD-dependent oxidoreductase [candidate division KSB1 bacterium]
MDSIQTNCFIAGGGPGGFAAALFAAQQGLSVALVEPCDWIGGQITSQGVSALDEHEWIETFGGTRSYYRLRQAIRDHYRPYLSRLPKEPTFNPGNCWVSRLAFEPRVALKILYDLLGPHLQNGQVKILTNHRLLAASIRNHTIISVTTQDCHTGALSLFKAACYIDATELGDLLPLVRAEYKLGAESHDETGEPHAPPSANANNVQSFTYPFVVQFCPGGSHIIPKPPDYEENRASQPYTLNAGKGAHAKPVIYKMFARTRNTPGSFWAYRRLIDAGQFKADIHPYDLSLINWHSNDFRGGTIIDVAENERSRLLQAAKNLSLGFLYWLQTEAPRDDGGRGYPELKLLPEVLGTEDGLSQFPYIRESRRIKALQTIREQDIVAACQPHARAQLYENSVGIGKYWLDIHRSKHDSSDFFMDTRPFQIPLGALIPQRIENLIAGGKNIGTTHLSNGAYRLHPIEWAIGEAAGALASQVVKSERTIREIFQSPWATMQLQMSLVEQGAPVFWLVDVPISHPAFAAIQWLAVQGIVSVAQDTLTFDPEAPLRSDVAVAWLSNLKAWLNRQMQISENMPPSFNAALESAQKKIKFYKTNRANFCTKLYQTLRPAFSQTFEVHS